MTEKLTISLYEETREDIKISVTVQIDANGDFSIDGYDTGQLVNGLKGRSDYEYHLKIKKPDKELLIKKLSESIASLNDDHDFIDWVKTNYGHNEGFSEFVEFVSLMGINKEVFFWP